MQTNILTDPNKLANNHRIKHTIKRTYKQTHKQTNTQKTQKTVTKTKTVNKLTNRHTNKHTVTEEEHSNMRASDRGRDVLHSVSTRVAVQERTTTGAVRYCDICRCIKPDRAHHCAMCMQVRHLVCSIWFFMLIMIILLHFPFMFRVLFNV